MCLECRHILSPATICVGDNNYMPGDNMCRNRGQHKVPRLNGIGGRIEVNRYQFSEEMKKGDPNQPRQTDISSGMKTACSPDGK